MNASRWARPSTSSRRAAAALLAALGGALLLAPPAAGEKAPAGRKAAPPARTAPAKPASAKPAAAKPAAGKPAAKAAPAPAAGAPRSGADRLREDGEYRLLQAELQVAQAAKPYLCFQWEAQPAVQVRVKGAVVASLPMRVEGDPGDVRRFRERFRGSQRRVLRAVHQKYLYTAKDQTPDSVLTIVGNVLNMEPEVLQRHIPEWFELKWADDLVLEVRADVRGEPMPGVDLKIVRLQQHLRRPFGEARLRVHMASADALTLYRVAGPGVPILSALP